MPNVPSVPPPGHGFLEALERGPLVVDGAMGSELFERAMREGLHRGEVPNA